MLSKSTKRGETAQGSRSEVAIRFVPLFLSSALMALLLGSCEQTESLDRPVPTEVADVIETTALPRPDRIIFISLDTVGSRHVGGYSDGVTPNLDKVAADGVRFDRFYAATTYTLPSHMSMLTGLAPIEHGVVNLPARLAPEVQTLASRLRSAGYETKALHEGVASCKISMASTRASRNTS